MTRLVYLLDVDNTLLDNDRVVEDLRRHLIETFGEACQERYWILFEDLRRELGYADYLGALQRFRLEHPRDPHVLELSLFLLRYPFSDRVYPDGFELIQQLSRRGRVVILSDGDVVFQPRKVEQSGLWRAVNGHVLIYVHKEQMLDDVANRYPADHYVMFDDKLRILGAMKQVWRDRVTTVFVRQGHYAHDPSLQMTSVVPDLAIDAIGDALNLRV